MTTSDYERALSRAHAVGLKVMGKGEWTGNGAAFYVVTSASEAGRFHLVTLHAGRLSCDCTAGQHGRMCQHRALVHESIEAERKPVAPVVVTHDRETAMLANRADNRSFSIWASN